MAVYNISKIMVSNNIQSSITVVNSNVCREGSSDDHDEVASLQSGQ